MCGYSSTAALGKCISHTHLSLIKDESMNPTQLLILPHVQSLLLTILKYKGNVMWDFPKTDTRWFSLSGIPQTVWEVSA